jgi:two-component system, chemotaxis family, response regulator Rcp1
MEYTNHIWLAEDNEADVRLMEEALREHTLKYDLRICRDGEEALRMADAAGVSGQEPCPDILILDLHLPKVDGPEVLRRFRANTNCANTPVIVFSSSISPADRLAVETYDRVSFLRKPIDLDEYLTVGQTVRDTLAMTRSSEFKAAAE